MSKINFHTDRKYLPPGQRYVPLLYPFWGSIEEDAGNSDADRFDEFSYTGKTLFSLVLPEIADVFLLPCEWRSNDENHLAKTLSALARKHNKPLIVFFNSDSTEDIPLEGAIVFRTSMYASRRKHNEFGMPGWSRDFLKAYCNNKLCLRDKPQRPKVGYTGYVDYDGSLGYLIYLARRLKHLGWSHPGERLRGTSVRLLRNHPAIDIEFILRKCCMTGTANESSRQEYVRNILESDYSIAVRGGGNFSYRLYEIMSCGRIPLFINTDCVLPFDHLVDWHEFMVWIEDLEISDIGHHLLSFHESLTTEKFIVLQCTVRKIYEEWLSPFGFYSNIWRCIPGLGCHAK